MMFEFIGRTVVFGFCLYGILRLWQDRQAE